MTFVAACGAETDPPEKSSWRDRFEMTELPVFPPGLATSGVTVGSASFLLLVNADGELEDFVMLEASHLDVGEAIARVIPEWKFFATEVDGQRVNAASRIEVNLRSSGSVALLAVSDDVQNLFPQRKLVGRGQSTYRVASLTELDYMPELISAVQPPPPPPGSIGAPSVTIVFQIFIDENGRVRIPLIQDAGNGKVDLQVLETVQHALMQWRFTPPLIEGRPVMVRVQQPFRLTATNTGQAD